VRWAKWICGLALPLAELAAQQFTGSKSCAACHAEQTRRHAASMHQRALRPAMASPVLALLDRPVMERNGVELHYSPTPEGLQVESRLDGDSQNALMTWIFGAGAFAFTPVGIRDGVYLEHRVSWYSALHRPGMTLGHPSAKPASAAAALGQPQTPQTIFRCFNCHATNVKPGPDLSAMQAGVQCERCHGPAAAHVKAPSRFNIRRNASVEACAECHRMPDGKALLKPTPEIADPMSIRFAPVGLMASKCFLGSGSLTCITCHDPHGRPYPEKPEYEKKCLGCHAQASLVSSQCPRVENGKCLGCHMVKATPVPGLTFTDHRIRIYPVALKAEALRN
jgi:hypothetical protein